MIQNYENLKNKYKIRKKRHDDLTALELQDDPEMAKLMQMNEWIGKEGENQTIQLEQKPAEYVEYSKNFNSTDKMFIQLALKDEIYKFSHRTV